MHNIQGLRVSKTISQEKKRKQMLAWNWCWGSFCDNKILPLWVHLINEHIYVKKCVKERLHVIAWLSRPK